MNDHVSHPEAGGSAWIHDHGTFPLGGLINRVMSPDGEPKLRLACPSR